MGQNVLELLKSPEIANNEMFNAFYDSRKEKQNK